MELVAEYFNIFHEDKVSATDFDTIGGYLLGTYQMGEFKPYYRFDYIDVGDNDPFFTGDRGIDRTKNTVGIRWDVFKWNALKLEYSITDKDSLDKIQELMLNSSFVF